MKDDEIGIAKFKEQCYTLLEKLRDNGLVITKHGKPIAKVIPYGDDTASLIGSLKDKIQINGDILSTDTTWNTEEWDPK